MRLLLQAHTKQIFMTANVPATGTLHIPVLVAVEVKQAIPSTLMACSNIEHIAMMTTNTRVGLKSQKMVTPLIKIISSKLNLKTAMVIL